MIPLILAAASAYSAVKGGSKAGGSGGGAQPLQTGDKRINTGIFQVGRGNVATAVEANPAQAADILKNTQPFSPIAAESGMVNNTVLIIGGIVALVVTGFVVYKINK